MAAVPTALAALRAQLSSRPWPVTTAALLLALGNVCLFIFDRPYTAADGARHWGDWTLSALGLLARPDLVPPWLYSGSLLNLGVILGGLAGALSAREFAVRVPPRAELVKGAAGGLLLGAGAMLALGCNIGGFWSATSALSLAGLLMMLGLGVGAWLGLRILLWEVARHPSWSAGRARVYLRAGPSAIQPALGALVLALAVLLPLAWSAAGHGSRGLFLLFGTVFGLVFQRSRFCLVRAFREPFMTGDAAHTRAAALAIGATTLGFALLKLTDLKDRSEWVFPSAGVGALAGGVLFGIGMVLAGGCGAGTLWRVGEGQVKLWATLATFVLGASLTRAALAGVGWTGRLGSAVFLPAWLGWGGAVAVVLAVMGTWALVATWNESSGRLTSE